MQPEHQIHLRRRPAADQTKRSEPRMPARALASHLDIPLLHFYWLKHLDLLPLPVRGTEGLGWAMPPKSPDFLSAMSKQRESGQTFDESDNELRLVDGWSDGARILVFCGHRWCAHGVREPFPMRFPPCGECTKGAFNGGLDWRMYCYIIDVHVDQKIYRQLDKLSSKQGEHNWEKLLWRRKQQNIVNELLGLVTEDVPMRRERRSLYPWDTWCNGNQHVITSGIDFDCSVETMRVQLYNKARKLGLVARTSRTTNSLFFTFEKSSSEDKA